MNPLVHALYFLGEPFTKRICCVVPLFALRELYSRRKLGLAFAGLRPELQGLAAPEGLRAMLIEVSLDLLGVASKLRLADRARNWCNERRFVRDGRFELQLVGVEQLYRLPWRVHVERHEDPILLPCVETLRSARVVKRNQRHHVRTIDARLMAQERFLDARRQNRPRTCRSDGRTLGRCPVRWSGCAAIDRWAEELDLLTREGSTQIRHRPPRFKKNVPFIVGVVQQKHPAPKPREQAFDLPAIEGATCRRRRAL